jgi:hypothetical protein
LIGRYQNKQTLLFPPQSGSYARIIAHYYACYYFMHPHYNNSIWHYYSYLLRKRTVLMDVTSRVFIAPEFRGVRRRQVGQFGCDNPKNIAPVASLTPVINPLATLIITLTSYASLLPTHA